MDRERDVAEVYQKKTPIEHVLLRPDSYIGSVTPKVTESWVLSPSFFSPSDPDSKQAVTPTMEYTTVTYVPGLLKIFDELLVNAIDNKQRDPKMSQIRVTINEEEGVISVQNNGQCVPPVMHPKEGVHVPELVFGHLLTGSNFDDNLLKVTGGRNGYGAKLANIFSSSFSVEIVDVERDTYYLQRWSDHMGSCTPPLIRPLSPSEKKSNRSSSTCVTFAPDLSLFSLSSLGEGDTLRMMKRRVIDAAGIVDGVTVLLNDVSYNMTFKEYVSLYPAGDSRGNAEEGEGGEDGESGGGEKGQWVFHNDKSGNVRIAVTSTRDGQFQHVSFVNGIVSKHFFLLSILHFFHL
jgi:DNA topoisomerase-2